MILTGYASWSQLKTPFRGADTSAVGTIDRPPRGWPYILLAGCCLLGIFCLSFSSNQQAQAHVAGTVFHAPTLQVELGFQQTYRIGFWTPVFVTVNNGNSTSFSGMLVVSTYAGTPRTSNN